MRTSAARGLAGGAARAAVGLAVLAGGLLLCGLVVEGSLAIARRRRSLATSAFSAAQETPGRVARRTWIDDQAAAVQRPPADS